MKAQTELGEMFLNIGDDQTEPFFGLVEFGDLMVEFFCLKKTWGAIWRSLGV